MKSKLQEKGLKSSKINKEGNTMKRKFIFPVAVASLMILSGCVATRKMIPPTDSRGLESVRLIQDIKIACYAERQQEILKCKERNDERKELMDKEVALMDKQATKDDVSREKKLLAELAVAFKGECKNGKMQGQSKSL